MLSSSETPVVVVKELAKLLLESLSSEPNTAENKEQLRKLLAGLRQRHPEIFSEVSSDMINKRGEEGRTQIEQLVLSLSVVSAVTVQRLFAHAIPSRRTWILHRQRGRGAKLQTL